MKSTPFRRALAVLLCCQPVFWTSNVVLAQTLQELQQRGELGPSSLGGGAGSPFDRGRPSPAGTFEGESSLPNLAAPPDALAPDRGTPSATPIDVRVDPDKYICGPGDVLELNFWGVQNFRLRVKVDLEGRAFVSKIGYLDLRGKSLSEARQVMRESVARFFPRLSFDAALAEPRTFLVQVVDDVVRPGSYPARAVERVATLIARAGGYGKNASKRRVEIRRLDGRVIQADLLRYALTGDVKHNPYLLDGDVVRVPYENLSVTIDGAVNRPGRYELVGSRDLAELVEVAGGLAPTSTKLLPITVVRRLPDDRQDQRLFEYTAEGQLPAVPLQHEDEVRIPSFEELQRSVMVIGAIAGAKPAAAAPSGGVANGTTAPEESSATRRLPFVLGDSVRTLLERVGGVGALADLSGSYVLRDGKALPVDLYSLVMLRDLKADLPVELGDTLVIPFKRQNILVEGAVFRPGAYPYNPTFGIEQYLSLAGGRNRFAQSLSNVRVVAPSGVTKEYARDLKIEPGSSLVVPERNFSRSEVVQILLSAAGIIVSGAAVVIAASR